MNSQVTINIPEIGWPVVILALCLIVMCRTDWLIDKRPVRKHPRKPKKSAPKRQPKTAAFSSSRNGQNVRVWLDDNKPQSLNDIQ